MKLPPLEEAIEEWRDFNFSHKVPAPYFSYRTSYEDDYKLLLADCEEGDKKALRLADQFLLWVTTQRLIS